LKPTSASRSCSGEIKHTFLATEGAHQWRVWRRYLNEFAPLLFAARPAP
jgi:hypothetical protein